MPSRLVLQTYYTAILTAAIPKILCKLGNGITVVDFVATVSAAVLVFLPLPCYKIHDAMKALTIPASRPSMRERMRTGIKIGSATVSNLRVRIDSRACLTVAIVAILVFFACLGLMYVPGIVVSGLIALTCTALAPIEQEGGAV